MHASESAALLDSLMAGLSNSSDSTLRNQVGYLTISLQMVVSGVEWSGVEWSGVEWSGVEWSGEKRREEKRSEDTRGMERGQRN